MSPEFMALDPLVQVAIIIAAAWVVTAIFR